MDPFTISALAGAGLGLAKSELFDKQREARERAYQAQVAKFSPWTHVQATPPKEHDPLGSTIQGGLSGAAFGQGLPAGAPAAEAAPAAAPYSGPPAVPQPPYLGPQATPSGYPLYSWNNPQNQSYSDWLYMNATGQAPKG